MRTKQCETGFTRSRRKRSGISSTKLVAGSLLWVAVFSMLGYVAYKKLSGSNTTAQQSEVGTTDAQTETQAEPVQASTKTIRIGFPTRELPDFEFPECMGGTVSRDSLKGKRWLANFFFTRCNGPCPLMIRDVSELHRKVAKTNPDFLFVTFSVDSSFDSMDVLRKYSDTFLADHDRWKFLTGDEQQIHDLIRRGFSQYVQPSLGEMRKPGFEVAHSNRAVLVNEEGVPVATYLMTVPEDVVKLRRVIEGKEDFPQPGPALTVEPSGENPQVPLNLLPVREDSKKSSADPAESATPADPAGVTAQPATSSPFTEPVDVPSVPEAAEKPSVQDSPAPTVPPASDSEERPQPADTPGDSCAPALTQDPPQQARSGGTAVETPKSEEPTPDKPAALEQAEAAASTIPATGVPSENPDKTAEQGTVASSSPASKSPAEKNRSMDETLPDWVRRLPTVNATLNALCTILLLAGYVAIRRSHRVGHRNLMISAFVVSTIFLICYVLYHEALYRFTGERGRSFVGSDLARILYFCILIPHVILAAAVPILALRVFWLAWKQQWAKHRRLARITLPIWLFVSITGVLIYGMLYHWPWRTMEPVPVIPGSTI